MSTKPRILLVEDSVERIQTFRRWVAGTEFALIEASSGGRAKGILRKGMTEGIAGICLDHDLDQQPMTDMDLHMSASNLLDAIITSIPRQTPILIHSMNVDKPVRMEQRLRAERFVVTRIRMVALTERLFSSWLEDVRDNWES